MLYSYLRVLLADKKKVKKFSFTGYKCIAYVKSVYDGDTITIDFYHGGKIYEMSCRLMGIDTPEIKTSNPSEKEAGIRSRDHMRSRVLGKYKKIVFEKMDKYGRPLIYVYDKYSFLKNKKSINQEMLDLGLAVSYDGGKKEEFKLM